MAILSIPTTNYIYFTIGEKISVNYCHIFTEKWLHTKIKREKDKWSHIVCPRDGLTEKGAYEPDLERMESSTMHVWKRTHWDKGKNRVKGLNAGVCLSV